MAECLQQTTYIIGHGLTLGNQLRSGHQQHAQGLSVHALDGNLAEPSGSHDLSETKCVRSGAAVKRASDCFEILPFNDMLKALDDRW
jgi:hypothetical protein